MALELHFQDMKGKLVKTFVITIYLPFSLCSAAEYEESLDQLQARINRCSPDCILVIGGDFNASIGTTTKGHKYTSTGPYGNPHRSEHGEILHAFMNMNELSSCATYFDKANHDTWSFQANGEHPKQIDHIMVRHADRNGITDCNTKDEAGVMSNHLAIKATVWIAHFIPKKKQPKKKT